MTAAQGSTEVDFGAFPGDVNAVLEVTGQADIEATALVDAWLTPSDTADHSIDEHVIDGPDIFAGAVVAGVGFTIYARARSDRAYGLWSVSWVWNNPLA